MFIINTFLTCFGLHYAHLQENKTCATARGVLQHTSCSPEDGHNDAQTCREIVDNKHLTVASCWLSLSLHDLLTMHGHRNLKYVRKLSNLKMVNFQPWPDLWSVRLWMEKAV